jgi:hypothetical protein
LALCFVFSHFHTDFLVSGLLTGFYEGITAFTCSAVVFKLYDWDGDGFVSRKELVNVLRMLGTLKKEKDLDMVSKLSKLLCRELICVGRMSSLLFC